MTNSGKHSDLWAAWLADVEAARADRRAVLSGIDAAERSLAAARQALAFTVYEVGRELGLPVTSQSGSHDLHKVEAELSRLVAALPATPQSVGARDAGARLEGLQRQIASRLDALRQSEGELEALSARHAEVVASVDDLESRRPAVSESSLAAVEAEIETAQRNRDSVERAAERARRDIDAARDPHEAAAIDRLEAEAAVLEQAGDEKGAAAARAKAKKLAGAAVEAAASAEARLRGLNAMKLEADEKIISLERVRDSVGLAAHMPALQAAESALAQALDKFGALVSAVNAARAVVNRYRSQEDGMERLRLVVPVPVLATLEMEAGPRIFGGGPRDRDDEQ